MDRVLNLSKVDLTELQIVDSSLVRLGLHEHVKRMNGELEEKQS